MINLTIHVLYINYFRRFHKFILIVTSQNWDENAIEAGKRDIMLHSPL